MLLRSAVQHVDLSTLRVTLRVTVDRSKDGGREENLTLNDSKERLKINVWLASYLLTFLPSAKWAYNVSFEV